jgi:acyl-CoA dehydrogenase
VPRLPAAYWRALDREKAYPTDFVAAMTKAGLLGVLIPEEYGGGGLGLTAATAILEEVHASGGNAAALHAQMYTMGTVLRHGSTAQKETWLPRIADGSIRLQAFGVTEPTAGTDTTSISTFARREGDTYVVNGQKVWTSRAEHSDLMVLLARTTPKDQVARKSDGLSVFLVDMREAKGNGLTIKPIATMLNHATTEVFFDNLVIPADSLIGEEGKGFRYILDGMNAERILIGAECLGDAAWLIGKARDYANSRVVFGRPIGQNQGVQFPIARAYAQAHAARLTIQDAAARYTTRAAVRRAGQYRQDAGLRGLVGGGRHVPADPRRLRLRRGVRHRAQVPRDAALPGGPDLDEPDPGLCRRARARPAALLLMSAFGLDRSRATRTAVLAASDLARLAAVLDRPETPAEVPPAWHWACLAEPVRRSDLGPDGHPRRGLFLPPIEAPRRMFAAADLRFTKPLHSGLDTELVETIAMSKRSPARAAR